MIRIPQQFDTLLSLGIVSLHVYERKILRGPAKGNPQAVNRGSSCLAFQRVDSGDAQIQPLENPPGIQYADRRILQTLRSIGGQDSIP